MSEHAINYKTNRCNRFCLRGFGLAFLLAGGLFAAKSSFAEQSPELPSVVTFTSATDSDNGSEFYLGTDVALADGQRLSLVAGKINLGSQNQFNSGLDPLDYAIGFNSNPGKTFPVGIEYEFWGEEGEFTIQALRGTLGYNHKWFSVSASPQSREFELYFQDGRKLKFSSKGYSVKLDIQGVKNVLVSLGYTKNDYDLTVFQLLSALARRETDVLRRLLGLTALYVIGQRLQSAASFDDRIYNAGVNYYFSWGDVGAYWIRSRSVIKDPDTGDQIFRQSYGVTTTVDLTADWSLGLQLGTQSFSNDNSTLTSGSALLSYYW